VGQQISRRENARRLSPSDLRTTLPEVRPASDIKALPSHTPAKATTDRKEQLAAVAHPAAPRRGRRGRSMSVHHADPGQLPIFNWRSAEIIEAYFPNVPKIELNCRGKPRPGWSAWGLEAEIEVQEAAE
jgi:hypothetical protein